jgi:hypothetical protein
MAGQLHMTNCTWITSDVTRMSSFFFDVMQRGTAANTLVRTLLPLKSFRERLCHVMLMSTDLDDRHIEQLLSVAGQTTISTAMLPHVLHPWHYKRGYPEYGNTHYLPQLTHCCHVVRLFHLHDALGIEYNNWCIKYVLPVIWRSMVFCKKKTIAGVLGLSPATGGEFFLDHSGATTASDFVPYSAFLVDYFFHYVNARTSSWPHVDMERVRLHLDDDASYTTVDVCAAFLADIHYELTVLLCAERHPEATIALCRAVRHRMINDTTKTYYATDTDGIQYADQDSSLSTRQQHRLLYIPRIDTGDIRMHPTIVLC